MALSVYALTQLTSCLFDIKEIEQVSLFAFFGTIVGYNFVKYDALARVKRLQMNMQLKMIVILSFLSFLVTGYYFFQLRKSTQVIGFVFLAITLLYTLPFFPNKNNARNWAGIKIYIVALCWVGVTLFLPIINESLSVSKDVFLVALQRYILIFVLILIFEIIDLKWDDPHLKTVPQQIGVKNTKRIGVGLLFLFVLIEFLLQEIRFDFLLLKIALAGTTMMFLLFSNENRSRYYASFWVESIPIFWWFVLVLLEK